MIVGTGIDLINISRVEKVFYKFGNIFTNKILTHFENNIFNNLNLSKDKIAYLAKRFAAKEAFAKALGEGIGKNVGFKDIEIRRDEKKKPYISYSNKLKDYMNLKYNTKVIYCHLSIADTQNLATAYVVIERE